MSNELTHNPGQFDEVIHIIDNARSRAMKAVNAELRRSSFIRQDRNPYFDKFIQK